jgi:DNA-binding XRE family transcriptional regulator
MQVQKQQKVRNDTDPAFCIACVVCQCEVRAFHTTTVYNKRKILHMKYHNSQYFNDFICDFFNELQHLTHARAQNFTQSQMAEIANCSLRTIQHFENGRSYNLFLFYLYRKLFKNK